MADIIQTILLIVVLGMLFMMRSGSFMSLFSRQRKIILDSCALIDGRIVEILHSGFIVDNLIIPQFILNELQMLADGHDSHKRERARFGLDIAHQLQDSLPGRVTVDRSVLPGAAIDDKLVQLARKSGAALYTTDYNLAKVAAVEGVNVLNVNELAQGLRPITLPGENLSIKIIQKGSNRDQGVGYLEDGTMIVVDGAARHVGKTMPVTITRMHQTVAGKMVFGQVGQTAQMQKSVEDMPARGNTAPKRAAHPTHAATKSTKVTSTRNTNDTQSKLHSRLHRAFRRRRTTI